MRRPEGQCGQAKVGQLIPELGPRFQFSGHLFLQRRVGPGVGPRVASGVGRLGGALVTFRGCREGMVLTKYLRKYFRSVRIRQPFDSQGDDTAGERCEIVRDWFVGPWPELDGSGLGPRRARPAVRGQPSRRERLGSERPPTCIAICLQHSPAHCFQHAG